jgi:uncharacterized membrane protein HdeD (DUF308 family)
MNDTPELKLSLMGFDSEIIKKFSKHSLLIGGLLLVLGLLGIILPSALSLVASAFLGWMLLTGGILSLYFAFLTKWRSAWSWVKAVLLLFTGTLILVNPVAGIMAVALLIALYLMMDAVGNITLAQALYPNKGWGWMAANGVLSFALAMVMIFAYPATTVVLVGLYLGISLLFDGIALIMLGLSAKHIEG